MNSPHSPSYNQIQFKDIPVQIGPLSQLEKMRSGILDGVSKKTFLEFENLNSSTSFKDVLLGEALYAEKMRLKRERFNLFTRSRMKDDKELWREVQSGLFKSSAEMDRNFLLEKVIHHYAEEIGGHFSPSVYRFATRFVPWCFSC